MKVQNVKNHTRLVAGWHGVTFFGMLALLIGSFINLSHSAPENVYSASLICLIAFIFIFLFWFVRVFALKAQDRAIRAEENLRCFVLTGKLLDSRLHLNQIIALRFASDDEVVALAKKAVDESLSSKAIKQSIIHWKADEHRV
jgi:hypothetical protein